MNNILIIGAHYDDAELGAGGTAAKLVEEGKNVYKVTLTDNETVSKNLNLNIRNDESIKDSESACRVLGVTELREFIPEKCSELVYSKSIMQRLEDLIFKYDIDTVFIHFSDDCNQDHVESYLISKTAARHCKNILMYKSNLYITEKEFSPTIFFDITNYVDKKIEALNQYEEQHNRFNKLFEANIARNKLWGYSNKVEFAEGFMPIKFVL